MKDNHYLIGLDLDGTLLNKDSVINPLTRDYLISLDKKGYHVVITTGRPVRNAINFYNELNLHSPLVCYNGSEIINPHDPSFNNQKFSFPKETILSIIKEIPPEYIDVIICESDETVWMSRQDDKVADDFWYKNVDIVYGPIEKTLDKDPITFIIRAQKDEYKPLISKVVSKYPNLHLRFWQGYLERFCEVFYEGISKAEGLKFVCKYYDIPYENTIAFGDEINDLEILQFVKHGFAMKNSNPELLKEIHNVTEFTNDDNGVMKELQKIIK